MVRLEILSQTNRDVVKLHSQLPENIPHKERPRFQVFSLCFVWCTVQAGTVIVFVCLHFFLGHINRQAIQDRKRTVHSWRFRGYLKPRCGMLLWLQSVGSNGHNNERCFAPAGVGTDGRLLRSPEKFQ